MRINIFIIEPANKIILGIGISIREVYMLIVEQFLQSLIKKLYRRYVILHDGDTCYLLL